MSDASKASDWLCRHEGHHWVWSSGPHLPRKVAYVGRCSLCGAVTAEVRTLRDLLPRRLRRWFLR